MATAQQYLITELIRLFEDNEHGLGAEAQLECLNAALLQLAHDYEVTGNYTREDWFFRAHEALSNVVGDPR